MPRLQLSAQSATAPGIPCRTIASSHRRGGPRVHLCSAADRKSRYEHYRIPKRELLYAANHVDKTTASADRHVAGRATHRSLAGSHCAPRCADVVLQDDWSDGGGGQRRERLFGS